MNPLQPTKVFVPATERDNDYCLCIDDMMGYVKSSDVPYVKEQSLYCFTREELVAALRDAILTGVVLDQKYANQSIEAYIKQLL